jgi:hypothetical protein
MASSDGDADVPDTADDEPTRRYADIDLSTGEVVIYDTTNAAAWVQSDTAARTDDVE